MTFDYYYGSQADQFSFIRIPRILLTEEMFSSLTLQSKMLYSILLDRMSISMKNGWFDEENRAYIIYQISEIWNRRQANKLKNLIKRAAFSVSSACIEDIEYIPDRKLDKAQMLRFSTCQYINEGHHIILKGATGSGKTYIACALGNATCRKFKTVRYIRMPELLDELSLSKQDGTYRKVINAYCKTELLIIDEWLIRKLSTQERYDLLEIIEKRVNSPKGYMILCTQYTDEEWYGRIDPEYDEGSPVAEAIMDRITNNALKEKSQ